MGYRLEISEPKSIFYGTKLYGYVDLEECESIKWLLDKKFITEEDVLFDHWNCGGLMPIVMVVEEFKEFIVLYDKDCQRLRDYKDSILNDEMIKNILLKNDFEMIVLSWG